MSHKNAELVVPYNHQPAKPRSDASLMVSQTLPMAAMFMRNKLMSWASVFMALQAFLTEPANKPALNDAAQPPLLRLGFAMISLVAVYLEFFFPATSPTVRKAATLAAKSALATATAAATAAAGK